MKISPSVSLVVSTAILLTHSTAFKCAPTVPPEQCLSSASAFSAGILWPNRTTIATAISTTPTPATAAPAPISEPVTTTPCILTRPYGTGFVTLSSCTTPAPKIWHAPGPPIPVSNNSNSNFYLQTPPPPRYRIAATPTGTWTTCVQGGPMNCTNALCNRDPYGRRCTDIQRPRETGRWLCVDGIPNFCLGFWCGVDEAALAAMKDAANATAAGAEGAGGGGNQTNKGSSAGICAGYKGPVAIMQTRPTNRPAETVTCVGSGGAGKGQRLKQNGECWAL